MKASETFKIWAIIAVGVVLLVGLILLVNGFDPLDIQQ